MKKLTEDIEENIRARARLHINSTDPCSDHWDSIETPEGFVDFNVWKDDDYKNGEWIISCYDTYSTDDGNLCTDTATFKRLDLQSSQGERNAIEGLKEDA